MSNADFPSWLITQAHIVTQSAPEERVRQVSPSLIQIADGVSLRHRAIAQAFKLGKDEPHPMGPFAAFGKFISDLVMDVRLSVHEAN